MPQQITQGRQLISMLTWVLSYVISTLITRLAAKGKITTEDPFQKISHPSMLSRIMSWFSHLQLLGWTFWLTTSSIRVVTVWFRQFSDASSYCYRQKKFCCNGGRCLTQQTGLAVIACEVFTFAVTFGEKRGSFSLGWQVFRTQPGGASVTKVWHPTLSRLSQAICAYLFWQQSQR